MEPARLGRLDVRRRAVQEQGGADRSGEGVLDGDGQALGVRQGRREHVDEAGSAVGQRREVDVVAGRGGAPAVGQGRRRLRRGERAAEAVRSHEHAHGPQRRTPGSRGGLGMLSSVRHYPRRTACRGATRDRHSRARPHAGCRADAAGAAAARPLERPVLRARRRLPRRPAARLRPDARRARPRCQGGARRPRLRARPPLPARRGHRLRRRHRRQLQAGPAGRGAARGRVHRLRRRALHGRVGRHPHLPRPEGAAPRPRRRLLHGRHGDVRPGRAVLGGPPGRGRRRRHRPRQLHELERRDQGVHRRARRHRSAPPRTRSGR